MYFIHIVLRQRWREQGVDSRGLCILARSVVQVCVLVNLGAGENH